MGEKNFKFSVLVSVYYNENPQYFRQCLDSLFDQSLQPSEVVLVKDGKLTPELDEVITEYAAKYEGVKVIPLEHNLGLGKALNEGLKYCSYDIVARMDTDDIAKPYRFEKQMTVFEAYPEIDVVGAWIDEFEGDISNIVSTRKLPELHSDILRYAKSRCPMSHPVVMFKKHAVAAVGGYIHFPLFEDYYLWVRMLLKGAKFYNIQESLLYFRFSSDMFKRRGGWKYAIDELRFQRQMRGMEFISFSQYMKNILLRFITRILPNALRTELYKKLLRK